MLDWRAIAMSDKDNAKLGSTEQLSLADAKTTAEIEQIKSSIKRENRRFALEFIKTVVMVIGGIVALSSYTGKALGGE